MNVLVVYAHQDPMSFGSAMHGRVLKYFDARGDHVTVSDLYGTGFQPNASKLDFVTTGGLHQNYMFEQKRVAEKNNGEEFAVDIKEEIARVRAAELIVFEFPVWWSAPPAILKGWFDKVFALGVAWDGNHRYENGLLRGKRAFVVASAGDAEELYSPTGMHKATLVQHLYPLMHGTLALAGFDVLKPFLAYNLTVADDNERQEILKKLDAYLPMVTEHPEYIYKH